MIRSILDSLAYLASKGIMHRDLKPDNILIDKDGKVKIADFGLATYIDVEEYIFKKCGTPGYIAPEVFKYDQKNPSTNYDHQCDVFSAGCIFFYMLFGFPFFEATDASEILRMNRRFTAEFDAISTVKIELKNSKTKINKDGLQLLLQLLEFDIKKRMPAAQALNHPYFTPVPHLMSKVPGSNDLVSDPLYKPAGLTPLSAVTASPRRYSNMVGGDGSHGSPRIESPKSPNVGGGKDRFAEKDSLYLDMGRPTLNGKIDTINATASQNNSLLIQRRDSNASIGSNQQDSMSMFAKNASPDKRSRSFRVHAASPGQQSVLKAALLRNHQKNNSENPGEESKEELASPSKFKGGNYSERSASYGPGDDSEDESPASSPKTKTPTDKGLKDSLKTGSTPKRRFQPFGNKETEAK